MFSTPGKCKHIKSHFNNFCSNSHYKRQRRIKGKQKISDLISGELPNEIVKVIKSMNGIVLWFSAFCILHFN